MSDLITSVLESLPICAYMTDINNNLTAGSEEFVKVINREGYALPNLNLSDIYDKEHLEQIKEEQEEVLNTGKSFTAERQVVFPSVSFWGRVKHTPLFDDAGNIKYIVSAYENLEAKEEQERQKEYFIETLTHDLKIPTIAQLRGLELLKSEITGSLNQEQVELVSQIEQSCRYILDMISMIVNTYRFESGQKKLYCEKFNLSELLLECFEKSTEPAEEKNILFVYESSGPVIVKADREELKKVITNLLADAINHSDRNEKISVKIDKSESKIVFTITCIGVPFSQKDCMSMFDRFGAPKYSTIGSGIALYLCKKIIDEHKGKISASTDGARVNKYTFELPQTTLATKEQELILL